MARDSISNETTSDLRLELAWERCSRLVIEKVRLRVPKR